MDAVQQQQPLQQIPKQISAPKVTPQQKKKITPGISLAAGAVAGGIEATITYPFEWAKTVSQLGARQQGVKVSRSPFAVIGTTVKTDGFRAIYTGCSSLITVSLSFRVLLSCC